MAVRQYNKRQENPLMFLLSLEQWVRTHTKAAYCFVVACVVTVAILALAVIIKPVATTMNHSLHALAEKAKELESEIEQLPLPSAKLLRDLTQARVRRENSEKPIAPKTALISEKDSVRHRRRRSLPRSEWAGGDDIITNSAASPPSSPSSSSNTANESAGERETRLALESIFEVPFPKSRPNFLYNPVTSQKRLPTDDHDSGSGSVRARPWPGSSDDPFEEGADNNGDSAYLELDCFSRKLRVAAEFNGYRNPRGIAMKPDVLN